MKSFFKKANHDIKKSFSKQNQSNVLRKFGKTLQQASPIIKEAGAIVGDLAPVPIAVMGPAGIPISLAMKTAPGIANTTAKATTWGGNASVRDARKMAPNHSGIQAPKPSDNGPDNVFY